MITKKKILLALALISIILIIIGQFELINFSDIRYYKYISFIGFLIQTVIWISYYVLTTKKNGKNSL
jgi:hypothetical protein